MLDSMLGQGQSTLDQMRKQVGHRTVAESIPSQGSRALIILITANLSGPVLGCIEAVFFCKEIFVLQHL